MSWWVIALMVFVVLRVTRRGRWGQHMLRRRHGLFPPSDRSWPGGIGAPGERAPLPPPPPPPPDPRRDLERTISAARAAYVAGQITVEEYERKLDELYRTAEGKRSREI